MLLELDKAYKGMLLVLLKASTLASIASCHAYSSPYINSGSRV